MPGESVSAPVILSPLLALTINETQNAILHGDVKTNPTATVMWLKVNSSLPVGRYTIGSSDELVLRNVQLMTQEPLCAQQETFLVQWKFRRRYRCKVSLS